MPSKVRFSFDIGTNSIGWSILELGEEGTPKGIVNLGARIFSDGRNPKDKTSLAVARRDARLMRRQRDRKIQRMQRIFNFLVKVDLLPKNLAEQEDIKKIDPLLARSRAVRGEEISNYELGRAIYHLSRKRGFQSNRKDLTKNSDTKLSGAMTELKRMLEEQKSLSYGDFLYNRVKQGLSSIATVEAGFYPTRDLLKYEYDKIVEHQSKIRNLTEQQWQQLREIIFYQRPLRSVEVGKCSIYGDERRAFSYLPSYEAYRLLGELANLRWYGDDLAENKLGLEEIKKCMSDFMTSKSVTYKGIRKAVRISESQLFTVEKASSKDKFVIGSTHYFFGDKKKGILKDVWLGLSLEQQDRIAEIFFESETEERGDKLKVIDFLSHTDIEKLIKAEMPSYKDSTAAFSALAMRKILSICLASGETPQAVIHKMRINEASEGRSDLLDYYGKSIPETVVPIPEHNKRFLRSINEDEKIYGKIANPTVHIGLNQLRKLVNELIARYGKPDSVHIEFIRELKLSKDKKLELTKKINQNKKLNDRVRDFIIERGLQPSPFQMEKVKLWFEMEDKMSCVCIYTGQPISQNMVLSERVEVDHIIPFSRSLDDSMANKVLVLVEANRQKGNRTPFETWGQDQNCWSEILDRASRFGWSKHKRFFPNYLDQFLKENDFIARQLTDTSYLSKVAQKYFATILDKSKIVTSPGRLTAMVRRQMGLNSLLGETAEKNRNDHRHHALDALVVGIIDRSLLQRAAKLSEEQREKIDFEEPWSDFRRHTKQALEKVIVSHKVDHGKESALLDLTCYGYRLPESEEEKKLGWRLTSRKSLENLKEKDIEKIVSPFLRDLATREGLNSLRNLGVKKIKIFEVCKEDDEKIGTSDSYVFRKLHGKLKQHIGHYFKSGTYRMTYWRLPSGKFEPAFEYYFDAQKGEERSLGQVKPHPAAKLVMKLHLGDTVALDIEGHTKLFLVKSLRPSSTQIGLLEINKAEKKDDEKAFLITASKIPFYRFRKVHVSPTGKLTDMGYSL